MSRYRDESQSQPEPFRVPYHPRTPEYVDRLIAYIHLLEGYFASEYETPTTTRPEAIAGLRDRHHMTDLLGDPREP